MLKNVINFFTKHNEVNWTQESREACLKLLLLIMYSDDHLSEEESKLIKSNIKSFDWRGVHHEEYFVNNIITRVRSLRVESDVDFFINECLIAIDEGEVKVEIISLCRQLAAVDGHTDEQELRIISKIQRELS